MNLRYPWHCLIFNGYKKIENRNHFLGDNVYAIYSPVKSDWKEANKHPKIREHLETLNLTALDSASFTGNIIGLIKMIPISNNNTDCNNIYWDNNFEYHYKVTQYYAAPQTEYIKHTGQQGLQNVKCSSELYKKLKKWETLLCNC